jgi:hypothetical protein
MRIGRSLTITDIDTYITNNLSNYVLTEAQINTIIANAGGAIGCLSELLGIDSNIVPITVLGLSGQVIPNSTPTKLIWTGEIIDNLAVWAAGDPTEIHTIYTGLYDVLLHVQFGSNATGYRALMTGGGVFPGIGVSQNAVNGMVTDLLLSGVIQLKSTSTCHFSVIQTSGGNLTIAYADLLIARRAFLSALT